MSPKLHLTKNRIVIVVAIILVALAGWLIFGGNGNDKNQKQRIIKVETGTIEEVVTAQGKLEPKEYVDVGLQVSGQIQKLHVDVGDNVKKDQLLAEVDPRIYQSRLEADEAQLHSLQAQADEQKAALKLAEQQQSRNDMMIKSSAISKDVFDQGKAALNSAQAKLKSVMAQIDQINSTLKADHTNLEYTKIYAPMDGTVATLAIREGQSLNAVQSTPSLMKVSNLDIMTVRAQVAEADIMRLSQGMSVYFTTLGDLEKKFTGTVRQIQPSPEVLNDVVLYDVLIDADNKERRLMDGMSTQVFFVLGKAENVLVLPMEALGRREGKEDNDEGKAYNVRIAGEKNPVIIHTGLSDRTQIEVRSGLKVGDEVIVPVREKTTPGSGQNRGGGGGGGMRGGGGPRL